MKKKYFCSVMKKATIILWALLMSAAIGNAKVQLPQIFQSGMVLQRGTAIPVWGQADPGEVVTISLNKKVCQATADASGHWRVNLPAMKAGGPYTLVVEGKDSGVQDAVRNTSPISLSDVWIGDVWLCTGQSNMETTLERVSPQYPDELDDSNSMVRLFHVQYQTDTRQPSSDLRPTSWKPLNRENAWRFSSIGYFLGKQLQREKGVAQGIIESAWGGTPIEAWIAADTIARHFPVYSRQTMLYQNDDFVAAQQRAAGQAEQQWQRILNQSDPGMAGSSQSTVHGSQSAMPVWASAGFDDSQWVEVNQYNLSAKPSPMAGRREWIGSLWLRQHIRIDARHAGKAARLLLGTLYDSDVTYINGVQVGNTGYQYPPRRYQVPEGLLREGDNVITVRFINKNGLPHFIPQKPYLLAFGDDRFSQNPMPSDVIPLSEQWRLHMGTEMPRCPGGDVSLQNQPTTLYNAVLHPLAPYALSGVVWYQGESNTGNPAPYADFLTKLMGCWRDRWQRPELPFVIVQLANYDGRQQTGNPSPITPQTSPVYSGWAQLREAQRTVANNDHHAELACIIDLGETVDIHPLRKKEVAERIGLCFDRLVFKDKKVQLFPQPVSAEVQGSDVVITFDQPLQGAQAIPELEVAGADGRFVNATEAAAAGRQLTLKSSVAEPVRVRYAWKDCPQAVLRNATGLPVPPFEYSLK